jgi:hypothetical protein
LSATAQDWLARRSTGDQLIVIDAPSNALLEGDVAGWREQLAAADEHWIGPLLDGVRAKAVDELTIIGANAETLLETSIDRAGLRRFWRRTRPLAVFAANG